MTKASQGKGIGFVAYFLELKFILFYGLSRCCIHHIQVI